MKVKKMIRSTFPNLEVVPVYQFSRFIQFPLILDWGIMCLLPPVNPALVIVNIKLSIVDSRWILVLEFSSDHADTGDYCSSRFFLAKSTSTLSPFLMN